MMRILVSYLKLQDIGMGVMCHGGAILEISTKDESQQGISLFRL
jgi:hypothetical protein